MLVSPSLAASPRYIELTDGSVVRGEVVGAEHGIYRIRTETMGTLQLKESQIRSIGTEPPKSASQASGSSEAAASQEAENIKRRIMNDPALLNSINALKDDPTVESVMHDPEIMREIQAGDLNALQNNRKIERLIESPAVRDVLNALTK